MQDKNTLKVSQILENTPVITTASDVSGTLTVDILGRELGWSLKDIDHNVTAGCAAVVNENPVAFVQETGESNWWPLDKKLPKGVEYFTTLDQVNPENYEMILMASDRSNIDLTHPEHWNKGIVYHPLNLPMAL